MLVSTLTDRRMEVALGNQNKVKYMATQLLAKFEENAPPQYAGMRRQVSPPHTLPLHTWSNHLGRRDLFSRMRWDLSQPQGFVGSGLVPGGPLSAWQRKAFQRRLLPHPHHSGHGVCDRGSRGVSKAIPVYLFICARSHVSYERGTCLLRRMLRSIIKAIKIRLILLLFCYSSFWSLFFF